MRSALVQYERAMSLAATLVMALVVPLVACTAFGHWLDIHRKSTHHTFVFVGLVLGLTMSGALVWYIESHWRVDET